LAAFSRLNLGNVRPRRALTFVSSASIAATWAAIDQS
jgi:hypothetical protein